ncbi:MAG: cell division protein ZapA [Bacteroidota bacterium]
MGEMLSVKVAIANRTYPLRITQEEQGQVMKAAEMINSRVRDYEESFAVRDKQDLLAMTALHFANQAVGQDTSDKPDTFVLEANEQIDRLSSLLDDYLAKESPSQ